MEQTHRYFFTLLGLSLLFDVVAFVVFPDVFIVHFQTSLVPFSDLIAGAFYGMFVLPVLLLSGLTLCVFLAWRRENDIPRRKRIQLAVMAYLAPLIVILAVTHARELGGGPTELGRFHR